MRCPSPRRLPGFVLLVLLAWLDGNPCRATDTLHDLVAGLAAGETPTPVLVADGFQFTEGPVADAEGNILFSDIPAGKIYRWVVPQDRPATSPPFEVETWLDPSGNTNGLCFDRNGLLLACQMGQGRRVVAIDPQSKAITPLAERFEGKRLNAPNDLVLDKTGGIYFTDPMYGAKTPLPQGKTCVYYLPKGGKPSRLLDNLPNPNGVSLSPDGTTLYVIPSSQKRMMAYPVEAPGKLGVGRVFCELAQKRPQGNGGGDGLAVDVQGNLYITTETGVQVYSPAGKLLGTLVFPEQPANCDFGGPGNKTLFVTAQTSLYKVELEIPGHIFGAP